MRTDEELKKVLGEDGLALLNEIDETTTPEMVKQMDENWINAINKLPYFERKEHYKSTHDPRINLGMDDCYKNQYIYKK